MVNNLFKELKKDHVTVKDILKQMCETDEKACRNRERLFNQLKMELTPHMKAEEHVLYSAMKGNEEIEEDTMEALEEHHVAEMVFKELEKMPCEHEGWLAKATVLTELIDHHVKEEESQIFADVKRAFSTEQIEQIYTSFQNDKQKLRQALENPRTPHRTMRQNTGMQKDQGMRR